MEFTSVADDRDEFSLWVCQSRNLRNVDYLNFNYSEHAEDYLLTMENNQGGDNIMLAVGVPFKPLMPQITVSKLLTKFNSNENRPLKIVYRFVSK